MDIISESHNSIPPPFSRAGGSNQRDKSVTFDDTTLGRLTVHNQTAIAGNSDNAFYQRDNSVTVGDTTQGSPKVNLLLQIKVQMHYTRDLTLLFFILLFIRIKT